MTIMVYCDAQSIITKGPPIVRKFIGQPLENLKTWMRKQEGFKFCKIKGAKNDPRHQG